MPYYMNHDKLDPYAYTAQEYMSENRIKATRHYSVCKTEARHFHGHGLIPNYMNFAHDIEVSTIATTKAREEYNEELKNRKPNIALYGCVPSNLSSSSFKGDW